MGEPFLSEIKIMAFNYAPRAWALCNGQLLPINQNQALFSLLGTTYGGNGQTTFALPDLRGCVPVHSGDGLTLGEKAGQAVHTLSMSEMPMHIHTLSATATDGNVDVPVPNILARTVNQIYGPVQNLAQLAAGTVTNVGGSQAHENRQPYLVLNFCIALQGIFPSPN